MISAVCMLLMLAACGREEPAENQAIFDPAASITTPMPEPATAPAVESGMTVMVTLNDGHIATQETSIPVGPVVFTVTNAGKEVHGLHVEGPQVQAALAQTLSAGTSGTVAVTLQKGEYTLYCPIMDHRNNGETLTMTIPTQQ